MCCKIILYNTTMINNQIIYSHFKIILLIFFLVLGCSNAVFANEATRIDSLVIAGATSNAQIVDHEPLFRWTYTRAVDQYDITVELYQRTGSGDSLIWSRDIPDYQKTEYKLVTPRLLSDGISYHFRILTENRDMKSEAGLDFTMNSPPAKAKIKTPGETIFKNDTLRLSIKPGKDREITTESLTYEVKITDFSNRSATLVDTLVSAQDSLLIIDGGVLPENHKFRLYLRSFDGVEYSGWEDRFVFYMNRMNEPPLPFDLMNKGKTEIFTEKARLKWQAAIDPEYRMGGKIRNYRVMISPYEDFTLLHESKTLPGDTTQYIPKKSENHRRYYWKVIAIDSDSMTTASAQTGIYYLNRHNQPPPPAKIITPRNNTVLKPSDMLVWRQQPDKDRWDQLSYQVQLLKNDDLLASYTLAGAKLDSARKGYYRHINVSYDNRVRLQLSSLTGNKNLTEGESYGIAITTRDNWQGKNHTAPENATFIFDDGRNTPPLAPTEGFRPDSMIIRTPRPHLSWNSAKDPDINDRLKYEVMISTDPDFQSTRLQQEVTQYDDTFIKVSSNLMENKQYFWKVRSLDLEESKSDWSEINTFWVNAINEAPLGPVKLLYPKNYTEFNSESVFWWRRTTDPDPGDRVKYRLEIATDKNFNNKIYSYLIPALNPKINWPLEDEEKPENAVGIFINEHSEVYKLIDNRMYYWRVTAVDNNSLTSIHQFSYPRVVFNEFNDPPDIPGGFIPSGGRIVRTNKPKIRWQHSVDPDFADLTSTLSYQVNLSRIPDFPEEESAIYHSGVGNNFCKVQEELVENSKYYFRVNAFDDQGANSGWSMADSFYVNNVLEPPTRVRNMIPRDSIQLETDSPVISWTHSHDPDPDFSTAQLHYVIKYVPSHWIGTNKEKKNTKTLRTQKGENSIKLTGLKENHRYTYWIQAVDQHGKKSPWTSPTNFSINMKNEKPGRFHLIYPHHHADSVRTDMEFIWKNSHDPDPGDVITYDLYYTSDSSFSADVQKITIYATNEDSMVYDPPMPLKRATKYFWKVSAEDKSGDLIWGSNTGSDPFVFTTVGYKKTFNSRVDHYVLHDNRPNPFYSNTTIRYDVKEFGNVQIAIYNVLGERVKTLVNRNHAAGQYTLEWNGTDDSGSQVPGGMYLCRMIAKGFVSNKKMLLLR